MIVDLVANQLSPAADLSGGTCGRIAGHSAIDEHFSAKDKAVSQSSEDPPPPYTPIDPAQLIAEDLEPCPPGPTSSAIFNQQFCRSENTPSKGPQFLDRPTTLAPAKSPGLEEIYEGGKQLLDSTVALVEGIIIAIGRCIQALGGCVQGVGKVLTGIGLAIRHRRAIASMSH